MSNETWQYATLHLGFVSLWWEGNAAEPQKWPDTQGSERVAVPNLLNRAGAKGWELVNFHTVDGFSGTDYVFKRRA